MKAHLFAPVLLGLAALGGCATPTGPVEVTRFHDPAALQRVGYGTVTVEAAPGSLVPPLEMASYNAAVSRELTRLGFTEQPGAAGKLVAQVQVDRFRGTQEERRGPVSVGVGGSTGSYGSGVGLGVGIDLSGPPPEMVTTQMQVYLRERATNAVVWEGRAAFTVKAKSPLAQTQLGAARIAEALFAGFPGNNGETIEVK